MGNSSGGGNKGSGRGGRFMEFFGLRFGSGVGGDGDDGGGSIFGFSGFGFWGLVVEVVVKVVVVVDNIGGSGGGNGAFIFGEIWGGVNLVFYRSFNVKIFLLCFILLIWYRRELILWFFIY